MKGSAQAARRRRTSLTIRVTVAASTTSRLPMMKPTSLRICSVGITGMTSTQPKRWRVGAADRGLSVSLVPDRSASPR